MPGVVGILQWRSEARRDRDGIRAGPIADLDPPAGPAADAAGVDDDRGRLVGLPGLANDRELAAER